MPKLPLTEPRLVASRPIRADEQQPYAELRRLIAEGKLDSAASLCEDVFAGRPEVRDPYGHPVYLKESMRIALARRDLPRALALAVQVEEHLASNDPGAKVLLARYYVEIGDFAVARAAWQAVLARSPAFEEARQWLKGDPNATDAASAKTPSPQAGKLLELRDLTKIAVPVDEPAFKERHILRLPFALTAPIAPPKALVKGTESFTAAWVMDWHDRRQWPAHDVPCYFAADVVVSGTGQVWLNDELIVSEEIMPHYVYSANLRLPDNAAGVMSVHKLDVRAIDRPCVVIPGRMAIYGHFVIETLLGILQARRVLGASVSGYGWLLPRCTAPWMLDILQDVFQISAANIEFFDPERERAQVRQAVLPAMLHRAAGFHPVSNDLLGDLFAIMDPPAPPAHRAPRLFLQRAAFVNPLHTAARTCVNEPDLAMLAGEEYGFTAVSMETRPWREQVALLRQAEIVMGVCGSAMHGALFCPPETRVANLGRNNMIQSEIAALRGQQMAYLTNGFDSSGRFVINVEDFRRFLDRLCAGVSE